jgi:hypothetical protein
VLYVGILFAFDMFEQSVHIKTIDETVASLRMFDSFARAHAPIVHDFSPGLPLQ